MDSPHPAPPPRRSWLTGCLLAGGVGVLLLATGGWFGWSAWQERVAAQEEAARLAAEQAFSPALAQLDPARTPPAAIDLDRTMRVLRELDVQLREQPDLQGYLTYVASQDYTGVDPRVLAARKRLLEVLVPLYARQAEAEDQREMWEVTSEALLGVFSLVDAPSGVVGPVHVDRQQAMKLLEQVQAERDASRKLQRDIAGLQEELLDGILEYSQDWSEIRLEWEGLAQVRESAWLAASKQDWATTAREAERATQLPHTARERDAHLLLALAAIEGGPGLVDADPAALLADYLRVHPDETAPANLLEGVRLARAGDRVAAEHALDLSAKEYVRQSAVLSDRYDPQWERAQYLRRTSAGNTILHVYEASMLGAGYWSPDLQLARLAFDGGDPELGRKRIRDHFQRRREQQSWDLIVEDLVFCEEAFGEEFRAIFPEESWLDLELGKTLTGGELRLGVKNRSDRDITNATLLLALHLTDMAAGDYEVVKVGVTAPIVARLDSTSFGTLEVKIPWGDIEKGIESVIFEKTRSILITEDGVVWVDTVDFKKNVAEAMRAAPPPPVGSPTTTALNVALQAVRADVSLEVSPTPVLADDVVVTLPARLALLAPLFQLSVGGDAGRSPDENTLEGGHIRLRFVRVHDWEAGGVSPDLTIRIVGPGGAIRADFSGDANAKYTLQRPPFIE